MTKAGVREYLHHLRACSHFSALSPPSGSTLSRSYSVPVWSLPYGQLRCCAWLSSRSASVPTSLVRTNAVPLKPPAVYHWRVPFLQPPSSFDTPTYTSLCYMWMFTDTCPVGPSNFRLHIYPTTTLLLGHLPLPALSRPSRSAGQA